MITRNRMRFMAAEDAGGGAAVADPKEPLASVGDIYNEALAKAQGEEPPEPDKPAKEEKVEKIEAVPEKPASALDAALSEAPGADAKKDESEFVSSLKDLPETLPREGRGDHWKNARAAIDKADHTIFGQTKTIRDLTKQLEAAKTVTPESAVEITALQKQLDEYKDAVVAINVEFDPEHRKKFTEGRAAIVSKAAAKLDAFGGKGELLKDALAMSEGRGRTQAIKEALAELEPVEQNRVLQFVADVEKLDDEKAEIMKDPQGAWNKLQKTQADLRQKEAERAEGYKKSVFESVSKKLPEKLMLIKTVGAEVEGAAEWNSGVQQIKDDAFKLLGPDTTPEELAEAALWAKAGPKLNTLFLETRVELKKARAALKEYEGAEPGFRGSKQAKKTEKEAQLEKTPGDIYNETLARLEGDDR